MRSLMTNYVLYINRKYNRCGPLFQSSYKGILITDDNYLLHLTRYIHLNPIDLGPQKPISYPYQATNGISVMYILNGLTPQQC